MLLPLGARGNLPLKRSAQRWQVPVALDPVQTRLDGQQRRGHPAVLLLGVAPPITLIGVGPELRIERLDAVRRLQADAQGAEQAQMMQGERLIQAFVEACDRRGVQEPQFGPKAEQRRLRQDRGRLLVGRLERAAPERALALREVRHTVLSRMPLTPLHEGLRPEDRQQSLCAAPWVDDAEQTLLDLQAPLDQRPEQGCADPFVLGRGLHKAEDDLLPGHRNPQGDDDLVLREGLAIEQQGNDVIAVQRALTEGPADAWRSIG